MAENPINGNRHVSLADALRMAVDLHRKGQIEQAEYIYTKVIEHDPENAPALQFLGIVRHNQGRSAEGIALIEQARAIAPDDPGILMNLGNVRLESGQADGALEAYRDMLRVAPDLANGWSNLGVLLRAMGQPESAEEALRKAIALDAGNANAWHNLGNLLLRVGRTREAVECGLRAVTLLPRNNVGRKLLGVAYSYLGEIDEAKAVFRDWLAQEPDDPTAQHHLAALEGRTPERASDAYVEQVFDEFAVSFDARLETLQYRAPELVQRHLAGWAGASAPVAVLDVGCGTGLVGPLVRPLASRLVGIDLSANMLAKARQRDVYDALEKAEFIAFLAATPERFDAILAADALCYVGRMEAFAHNALAALTPGGILIATFEADATGADVTLAHSGRYTHGENYLTRTFADAGFADARCSAEVLRMETGAPVNGFILSAVRPA